MSSKIISNKDNLQVIYEDNHIIAINKRVGDIVQGDKTGDTPLSEIVKQYIAEKHNKPGAVFLGVVHRLDRPTSGIVIFARTSKALSRLNKLFAERNTKKTYWAIVKDELSVKILRSLTVALPLPVRIKVTVSPTEGSTGLLAEFPEGEVHEAKPPLPKPTFNVTL
jgi:23S rRNA-/tRNA-specific pseudouridylate synthase